MQKTPVFGSLFLAETVKTKSTYCPKPENQVLKKHENGSDKYLAFTLFTCRIPTSAAARRYIWGGGVTSCTVSVYIIP